MKNTSNLINKKDLKTIKQKLHQIEKTYDRYFSPKKLKLKKAIGVIKTILFILFFLILTTVCLIALSYLVNIILKNKETEFLLTFSYALLSVSASAIIGVFVAIAIGLHSANEFFNQTESKLFYKIELVKTVDNLLIGIYSILYLLFGLGYGLFGQYINSVFEYAISLVMSSILLIRFLIYSRKNKYDRFLYFLEHSLYSRKKTDKDVMEDYILMLNFTVYKTKSVDSKPLLRISLKRINYLNSFIEEMGVMLIRNENVVKEQNIIEEYFLKFAKNIQTPIELFSLYLSVSEYLGIIEKNNNKNLLKDEINTKENLLKCLNNAIESVRLEINKLIIPVDDLPETIIYYLDFYKVILTHYPSLIYAPSVFVSILEIFANAINKKIDNKNEKLNELSTLNDEQLQNIKALTKKNLESEGVLVGKISSYSKNLNKNHEQTAKPIKEKTI